MSWFADGGSVTAMSQHVNHAVLPFCLGCSAPLGPSPAGVGGTEFCPDCGARVTDQQAARLRWIAWELGRLHAARRQLVAERAAIYASIRTVPLTLAAGLASEPAVVSPVFSTEGIRYPGSAATPAEAAAGPVHGWPELSRAAAANLLLGLGGLLLVIAVAAFTAVSWGMIGAAGREGILFPAAVIALAAPRPLIRRGLRATAESVAGVGLALTVAVAWLAGGLVPHGGDAGLGLAAAACAALAAGWAAYGAAVELRVPRLAAIGLAQLPAPLGLIAITHWAPAVALGLVLTAAADVVLASRRPSAAEHLMAAVAAIVSGGSGVIVASIAAALEPAPLASLTLSAVFAVAAVTAVVGPQLAGAPRVASMITVAGGVLAGVALALPAATRLPAGWPAGAFAAGGAAVAAGGWYWARRRSGLTEPADQELPGRAWPLAAGGAAVLAVAAIAVAPAAITGLGYPVTLLGHAWSGPSVSARAGLWPAAPWPGSPAAPGVLALLAIGCWLFPASRGSGPSRARAVALTVAVLAAGSVPVAAGLPGWAALAMVTALVAALLGVGSRGADQVVAKTAAIEGMILAVIAVLWSLTGPAVTIAELAVLAVVLAAAAAAARSLLPEILATAGAAIALAGLALAAALAAGLPARDAAFAVAGVAAATAGAATLLHRRRPVQALVLDLAAGCAIVLAAAMAAQRADTLAVLATAAAALASTTAWMRDGRRRLAVVAVAAVAMLMALGSQGGNLLLAASLPYRGLARPWPGGLAGSPGQPGWTAAQAAALPLACAVLAACAAAAVVASGAWRGRRGSLDALAIALPVVAAPAGAAAGLGYGTMTAILLALTLALAAWTAAGHSLAPGAAALASAQLTVAWAAAAMVPTLLVLGCLAAACAVCAWRARLPGVRAATAALAVIWAGALAEVSGLAAGLPAWQAGLAVIGVALAAQLAAARLARHRPRLSLVVEITGWLVAAAGIGPSLPTPSHAAIALALTGAVCLGVALRRSRRPGLWAGLVLGQTALCLWLASLGVGAPEPYTVPAAAILTAFGRFRSGRGLGESSWVTYGPGLAVLLLPSLIVSLPDHGWVRPLLLGVAAVAITVAGARARLQAPLAIGGAVAVLDAGHELALAISHLTGLVPGWVPLALSGVVLVSIGATYEARLRNLRALRKAFASLN